MKRNLSLAAVACGGFLASAIVHACTFADVSLPEKFPAFWLLHVGIFIVFTPAVLTLVGAQRDGQGRMLAAFPLPAILIALALHVYAATVGVASMTALEGSAQETPAGYALMNHGQFIRELTYAEYLHAQALEARGFSCVWLMFYGVSALFYTTGRQIPAA